MQFFENDNLTMGARSAMWSVECGVWNVECGMVAFGDVE